MPNLTISHPANNAQVQLNQPFVVQGQATDAGMPEPHSIDSVTVEVGGKVFDATLKPVSNRKLTIVMFQANVTIVGGGDPHVITVTATNDIGISVKKTVTVFTGPPFEVQAPAVQIEIGPAPIDPTNPNDQAKVNLLVSQIQKQLSPLSSLLASNGQTLAGPNLVVVNNVLRVGLWIVGPTFPLVPANPPDFPLRVLPAPGATAGFNTVPFLPLPPLTTLGLAFGASIPTTTLQAAVNALMPTLKSLASQKSVSLDTVTVSCMSPASVTTSFVGQLGFPPATVSAAITEMLGTIAVPGANPAQSIPAVKGSSHSSGSDVLSEVLLGLISPVFLLEALTITVATPIAVGVLAGQATSIASAFVASIPTSVPFKNTISPLLPNFPKLVPNWTFFGATNTGMLGLGIITVQARDQSMVSLALSGLSTIAGYQADLAGGADQTYNLAWANLAPDPDKFTWSVTGAGIASGSIGLAPLSQRGAFLASFPLPLNVNVGHFSFNLAVAATETSGQDPTQTLKASASKKVTVNVLKNPKQLP